MMKNIEPLRGKEAEKWMNELWEGLLNKLAAASDKDIVQKILENLLSDYEKKVILKRLGVMALTRMGMSYQKISEILWLSPNTISTIKKNILGNKEGYKSYRKFYGGPKKYSGKVRIPKSFWEKLLGDADLWDVLIHPPRPRGIGLLDSAGVSNRSRNYRGGKGK